MFYSLALVSSIFSSLMPRIKTLFTQAFTLYQITGYLFFYFFLCLYAVLFFLMVFLMVIIFGGSLGDFHILSLLESTQIKPFIIFPIVQRL